MKKQWEKPELIVLTRTSQAELTLASCKTNAAPGGPIELAPGGYCGVRLPPGECENCQSRGGGAS